jgi:hypothetical protein
MCVQEVNKGAFAKSDMYVCHAVVRDTKNVLLVTDRSGFDSVMVWLGLELGLELWLG